MPLMRAENSTLVLIDLQERLVPALLGGQGAVSQTARLLDASPALDVPVIRTEQYPKGLGHTVPELASNSATTIAKLEFGAATLPEFLDVLPPGRAAIVAGCEAHVCVLQTVLALLDAGRQVFVVEDAVASRTAESKAAGLRRMAAHGADIVTTEMVIFEWLGTAGHPKFKELTALIK